AVNSSDSEFRRSSLARITDQLFLAKVARNSLDSGIRRAAAGKVTDEMTLARVMEERDPALTIASGTGAESEERDWNQALLKNTPSGYVEFWGLHTNTTRLKVVSGTLRSQMNIENFEVKDVTL